MHLLDLPGDGLPLGYNMPPPGTVGPLIRYSTRQTYSMLLTDARGMLNVERRKPLEKKCIFLSVEIWTAANYISFIV